MSPLKMLPSGEMSLHFHTFLFCYTLTHEGVGDFHSCGSHLTPSSVGPCGQSELY